MTPEIPSHLKPYEVFEITEDELANWRVSEVKLIEILSNPASSMHEIDTSTNNYGEFMFITISKGGGSQRICMTFWGLGYHEYRERWITQEWFWYQTPQKSINTDPTFSPQEAVDKIQERLDTILSSADQKPQSEIGALFEEMADLSDDDAALSELQDLGLL